MSLFDFFKKKSENETPPPDVRLGLFDSLFSAEDLTTPEGQAREGYRNNPYIRRACDLYGVLAAIPDPIIQDKDGNELKDHPLSVLLKKRPNPRMSKSQFFKTIGTHLGLHGESFLFPIWTVKGISAIEIADPSDVTVIETGDTWNPVKEYVINRGTAGCMRANPNEIIHIKLYNPTNHGARGMSPLDSAKRSVEMQNAIRDWNISVTKNGAKSSLIINVPRALTTEQKSKMKEQLNAQYGGKSNAGKGMILDDGKTASTIGMTAVEMDFINGIAVGAREISVAYGIGSELLGDSQNKTYSNMVESYKQLVQTTGIPLLQIIYDSLTAGILLNEDHKNVYSKVEKITYDPEQINDITVDKAALYTAMEGATYLTINEKRAKLGYDPLDDPIADTPLINGALIPLSDAGVEPVIGDELPFLKEEEND